MFCSNCGSPLKTQPSNCPVCETHSDIKWRNTFRSALPQGTPLHNEAYHVGRMLNQGEFTFTYLGCAPASNRLVVIKEFFPSQSSRQGEGDVLPPPLDAEAFEIGKDQFLEEAHTQAEFRRSEIASVDRFFEANHSAYLVTKYSSWPTLREKLGDGTRFSETEAIQLVSAIGHTVQLLHEKHILHLDLKPENIVLIDQSHILLPDFGLDKKLKATMEHGKWNFEACPPPGTEGYAAPEQTRCDSDNALSEATDVYGLGAVLYEVLTGTVPIDAQTRGRGHDLLLPVHQLEPILHEATEHAVMAALKLKQSARPQTVAGFLNLLATVPDKLTEPDDDSLPQIDSEGVSQEATPDVPAPDPKKSFFPQLRITLSLLNKVEAVCGVTLVLLILALLWMRIDAARRALSGARPVVAAASTSTTAGSNAAPAVAPSPTETPRPTPPPKPSKFNSIGTWQGTYDGLPATLVITEHKEYTSTGVLTLARRNGIFQVAFTLKEREDSNRLNGQETQTLYAPSELSWTLVGSSGTFNAKSTKISGPGYKLGRIPGWSFSKVSPSVQAPSIADEGETPTNNLQGEWRGQFDRTAVALTISKHQGDYLRGFLTSGPANAKIAVSGYLVPATSAVVMTETKVQGNGNNAIGALGQSVGTVTNGGANMSGTRTDPRSKSFKWSLNRSEAR